MDAGGRDLGVEAGLPAGRQVWKLGKGAGSWIRHPYRHLDPKPGFWLPLALSMGTAEGQTQNAKRKSQNYNAKLKTL